MRPNENLNPQIIIAYYECNLRAYLTQNDYKKSIESDADVYNAGKKIYFGRPFYSSVEACLYHLLFKCILQ